MRINKKELILEIVVLLFIAFSLVSIAIPVSLFREVKNYFQENAVVNKIDSEVIEEDLGRYQRYGSCIGDCYIKEIDFTFNTGDLGEVTYYVEQRYYKDKKLEDEYFVRFSTKKLEESQEKGWCDAEEGPLGAISKIMKKDVFESDTSEEYYDTIVSRSSSGIKGSVIDKGYYYLVHEGSQATCSEDEEVIEKQSHGMSYLYNYFKDHKDNLYGFCKTCAWAESGECGCSIEANNKTFYLNKKEFTEEVKDDLEILVDDGDNVRKVLGGITAGTENDPIFYLNEEDGYIVFKNGGIGKGGYVNNSTYYINPSDLSIIKITLRPEKILIYDVIDNKELSETLIELKIFNDNLEINGLNIGGDFYELNGVYLNDDIFYSFDEVSSFIDYPGFDEPFIYPPVQINNLKVSKDNLYFDLVNALDETENRRFVFNTLSGDLDLLKVAEGYVYEKINYDTNLPREFIRCGDNKECFIEQINKNGHADVTLTEGDESSGMVKTYFKIYPTYENLMGIDIETKDIPAYQDINGNEVSEFKDLIGVVGKYTYPKDKKDYLIEDIINGNSFVPVYGFLEGQHNDKREKIIYNIYHRD